MWAKSAVCGPLDANVSRLDDNVGLKRRLLDTNVGPFLPCLWAHALRFVGRYNYQFSLTTTPVEFERVHQTFIETYHTTAHQGLLKDQFDPPIPLQVLGETKGRLYSQEELARKFSRALFPRTTNRYGCVTLHSYHFYVEAGLPQTRVFLWVYGEQLRAVLDHVVLAEYHCRYDWREHKVKDIRDGVFYPTRFASPQGSLLPLNPQESLVLYRPRPMARQAQLPFPAQQLWLFELVKTA